MRVITLRNMPPELARQIRRKATEKATSLNKTVIGLLEESLGLKGKKKERPTYDDLEDLAGSWTREEAGAFDETLRKQRAVEPDLWK